VSEFSDSLNRETDFNHEARSILLFRAALTDIPDLWIPDVVAECSSENVLTMEFSTGERVDLYARRHPEEMPRLINTLVRLTLQTIFEEGLFHADPHPGNVLVLPDGRLSLLDFGMTGELDEPMRESLTLLLEAVVKGDARAATEAYLDMSPNGSEKVNRAALLLDIKAVLYDIHRSDLAEVSIGDSFDSLLRAGSRHGVHNPGEFFLLTRTFVILESMIRELDPEHDYLKSFREEIGRLTEKHFSLERIKEKTGKLAREMERLMTDAPGDTRRVLHRIAEGNLGRFQAPAIEALGGRVSRNLERLTGAIVSAGLIVGGSTMISAPEIEWHHLLGELLVFAGVLGAFFITVGALRRDRGRGGGRR
jgi:ubiquinone biosynthesis protein